MNEEKAMNFDLRHDHARAALLRRLAALALCLAAMTTALACCSKPCPDHPESGEPCPSGTGGGPSSSCPTPDALQTGADPAGCSAVQLACAVIPGALAALPQPSFAAQAEFDRQWKPRVTVWIGLLERIAETAGPQEAKVKATEAASLLTITEQDEARRRAMIEGGDLANALSDLRSALGSPACKPR